MYDAAALLHIWLYNITLWEILQLMENKSLYYFSKLWGFTSLVLLSEYLWLAVKHPIALNSTTQLWSADACIIVFTINAIT